MAKTATGSKKGLEAFNVLQQWRAEGIPDLVTGREAWNLTGGLVGNSEDYRNPYRLINVAADYTIRGGSLKDYQALKAGA